MAYWKRRPRAPMTWRSPSQETPELDADMPPGDIVHRKRCSAAGRSAPAIPARSAVLVLRLYPCEFPSGRLRVAGRHAACSACSPESRARPGRFESR